MHQNTRECFIFHKFVAGNSENKHQHMIQSMLIGGIGTPELLIIVMVILLLFGGKKIPELMKGIGKGVRSFKKGLNEDDTVEINKDDSERDNGTGVK